ncbi:hypothetical protein SRB5_51080 [Streptomyces sp. RB5]|uniref:Uncharacterized protein n=1 Tax=Streptomyces smaragdinus TaxID=2585196 RepID=A0A7K0CPI8_9ACTN|nr:hypothetical protein [Streptomyces smaragdinus]MQY14932.1 hypothetical protein [Streptomyces smaragdinus]
MTDPQPRPGPDSRGDDETTSSNGRPDSNRTWQSLTNLGAPPPTADMSPSAPPRTEPDPIPLQHAMTDRVAPPLPIPSLQGAGTETAPVSGVKIGVWGASGSGKTTFIGAMPIAAVQQGQRGRVNWVISGLDHSSREFLNDSVDQMVTERQFPQATRAQRDIRWAFTGEEPATRAFRSPRQINFALEVLDLPGEAFNPRSNQVSEELHEQAVAHLAGCDGLIYLFDPLLDANQQTESIRYFYGMANQMTARVRDEGRLHRGRLPHYIAVCITKFDHPHVFEPALQARWVTQEGTGAIPYVPEHLAEGFFNWICDTFRGASARLVRDALHTFFHADRMSFHASSAIGFRLNPYNQWDYRSYANVEPVGDGERICSSPPMPINVIEPLVVLEERLRGGKAAKRRRR